MHRSRLTSLLRLKEIQSDGLRGNDEQKPTLRANEAADRSRAHAGAAEAGLLEALFPGAVGHAGQAGVVDAHRAGLQASGDPRRTSRWPGNAWSRSTRSICRHRPSHQRMNATLACTGSRCGCRAWTAATCRRVGSWWAKPRTRLANATSAGAGRRASMSSCSAEGDETGRPRGYGQKVGQSLPWRGKSSGGSGLSASGAVGGIRGGIPLKVSVSPTSTRPTRGFIQTRSCHSAYCFGSQ